MNTDIAAKIRLYLNFHHIIKIKTHNHRHLCSSVVNKYPLQKAWYFDRIYRIYRILMLPRILSILFILSEICIFLTLHYLWCNISSIIYFYSHIVAPSPQTRVQRKSNRTRSLAQRLAAWEFSDSISIITILNIY